MFLHKIRRKGIKKKAHVQIFMHFYLRISKIKCIFAVVFDKESLQKKGITNNFTNQNQRIMQKKTLFLALVLGGMMLMQVGCSSYSYTSRSTDVSKRVINSTEATADLVIDYKKKVSASSDYLKFPNQAKQQAIYQCIVKNDIDVLVDPIFEVEKRGSNYRAKVLGFAGYYQEGVNELDEVIIKNYEKEDIEKFLLLTDPEFRQVYYGKGCGKGNVYNIKCMATPAKAAAAQLPVKQAKVKKAKKAKKGGLSALFNKEF